MIPSISRTDRARRRRSHTADRTTLAVAVALAAAASIAGILFAPRAGARAEPLALPSGPVASDSSAPARAPIALTDGAPSIEALLDQFLAAVEHRDAAALHRLRVNKAEFQEIIVPGMVAKGKPPRQVSQQPQEFFWSLNDTKSRYFADELFDRFGGRHYIERHLSFTKDTHEYAWYTTHGQVVLALRTADDPHVITLRTGTIAEVDGAFKFVSFQWEN